MFLVSFLVGNQLSIIVDVITILIIISGIGVLNISIILHIFSKG